MVKLKDSPYLLTDGSINIDSWLNAVAAKRSAADTQLIRHACVLSQLAGADKPTTNNVSCLQQGLAMAEMLLDLNLDSETIAAALVYSSVHYAELTIEDVQEHLGKNIAKLVRGVAQMEAMRSLHSHHHAQLENIRKMLLAMVDDVRVVLIKLTERVYQLRAAAISDTVTQHKLAKETLDIYAPLANRLGITQIKWELEDLSLRFLQPDAYKHIAQQLHQTRIQREAYIQRVLALLTEKIKAAGITQFEVSGRAKHIYSIHRKMQRKGVSYDEIYDINAVRVLVPDIEDCYTVLSIVQEQWEQIPHEFDDYIATPKPNGYRSIHTAVIGPDKLNLEVQIRTFAMHQESELGVAAHWRYKEGGQQKSSYEAKIAWLRQVLEWQKEVGGDADTSNASAFDDRVYVFTPNGDIVDLPAGATPLDFAYYIHSEVGHRCRGAKVNGAIVPLTYSLKTGDRIEILTTKQANPSRDWLNAHLGYLKTSRAKAKVHHWFKQQDFEHNLSEGKDIFERETKRLELTPINLDKIAEKLHYKSADELLAALGCGDVKISQILHFTQDAVKTEPDYQPTLTATRSRPSTGKNTGIYIQGVGNLMTHPAGCCKPVPGDAIIGWITQGRGVAIHRQDCPNILQLHTHEKLIEVSWGDKPDNIYPVDVYIHAYDRPGLIRDISTIFANEKMNLIAVNTQFDRNQNEAHMNLTIETTGLDALSKVLDKIKRLANIIEAKRQA